MKKILLLIVGILALGAAGGHYYFDKKFSPAANTLRVSGEAKDLKMRWTEGRGALLLPIHIPGYEDTLYLQVDWGAPTTLFYAKALPSTPTGFRSQGLQVEADAFKAIAYGKPLLPGDSLPIVGTLGTDILEKRTVVLDFPRQQISFLETAPALPYQDFSFKKRKILLPLTLGGETFPVLYDSGSSAYELITDEATFTALKLPNEVVKQEKGNSWGKTLKVSTAPANAQIKIGNAALTLHSVTHITGTSKAQNLLMKFSGMKGMVGNRLFLGHTLVIDAAKEKFYVGP
jgi:hypothetical protein